MGTARINKKGGVQVGGGETANEALKETVEAFLATLTAKQQSPETVKKRRDCLRRFLLFMEAKGFDRFADVDGGRSKRFSFAWWSMITVRRRSRRRYGARSSCSGTWRNRTWSSTIRRTV